MFKTETRTEYTERMARCRKIAATLDEATATSLVQAAQVLMDDGLTLTPSERDQYVAGNMRLRGEVA